MVTSDLTALVDAALVIPGRQAFPLIPLSRLFDASAVRVVLAVHAKPTPRPRVTKTGHAYLPGDYAKYAGEVQRQLALLHGGPPMSGPLVVRVHVQKERPKKTVLSAPLGDVDNLAKGVLDACTKTGRFWKDDVQIEHLLVTKAWGEDDEVELTINTIH